jgi:hypothetical protein
MQQENNPFFMHRKMPEFFEMSPFSGAENTLIPERHFDYILTLHISTVPL